MSLISLFLDAAPVTSGANAGSGSMLESMPMLVGLILVFVIMYFFMIRPQNKKQKETEAMLAALKKGDKVITIGGIHGVVSQVKENTVVVKVDDGTKIEFNRTAISTVVVDKPASTEVKPEKKGLFGRKAKTEKSEEEKKDIEEVSGFEKADKEIASSGVEKDE